MGLFDKSWSVVVLAPPRKFGEIVTSFESIAVRHLPQQNAVTIRTGLSKREADREVARLNALNSFATRLKQRAPYEDDPA
ncbi:MAG: hypothetical protein ACK5QX_11080 [bacterium]|jgi:hypothetical protein